MAKGPSGGAKYGLTGPRDGNSKGMPQGTAGGKLMNQTHPSGGGTPPLPPKGTSAKYEVGTNAG